jgi:hypothetical protein
LADAFNARDIDASIKWVLSRHNWRMRASRSGVEGQFTNSLDARMRDGKIVEARFYWDHDEALIVVGLEVFEYVIADGPSQGTWRRPAAMAEGFRSILTAWKDLSATADECRELDDCVLVLDRRSGRGKTYVAAR